MFLSTASTRRPIAMTCFILVLIMFGLNSYRNLGLDFYPDVEIPYVTVTVIYPGASPEEIEVDIAKKLEDAVGTIDGLKEINSTCMENVCQVMLEFQLGTNVDLAAMDVREKIDLIKSELPSGAEDPKILKFDPNASPVITMILTGDMSIDKLFDYADETLSPKLSSLAGVAEVQITGGEEMEVSIELDNEKLSSCGITVSQVIQILQSNNIKIPVGRIKSGNREINITYDSEYKSLQELGSLEISSIQGKRIYLHDLAKISMQSGENRTLAFYDSTPGVVIKVVKKGDSNAVKVIDNVRRVVNEINAERQLPSGMKLLWFNDAGAFIKSSVNDAWSSIIMGILLTAVILFLFLHEVRSTFIVVISMPISIVITFWAMSFFNYTLNMFTLLALGTSVGTLVANSIVVIENISKRLDLGDDPVTAAREGTSEVAIPVFASAMTNVVVFGPIAMMTSLVGRFLAPFAVTITIATLASLLISFTITPILAMMLLRKGVVSDNKILALGFKIWDKFYEKMAAKFDDSIDWVVKHPFLPVLVAFLLLVFTFVSIVPRVGSTFAPNDDRGEFSVKLEYPTYYNLKTSTDTTLEVVKKVLSMPEVLSTTTTIGKVKGSIGQASEGVYLAEINVLTTQKDDPRRKLSLDGIRDMLRTELAHVPNCIVTVNIPSPTGDASTDLELKISGDNLDLLNETAEKSLAAMRVNKSAKDVDSSVRLDKPEIRVLPYHAILRNMNLSTSQIGAMLRGSIEGIKSSVFKIGARSYDIRVKNMEKDGVQNLNQISFGSKEGKPLNIGVISKFEDSGIPIQIVRNDRRRAVKIFANQAEGVGLGELVKIADDVVRPLLPAGYSLGYGGKIKTMNEAAADFLQAIILAVLLTYLLIAAILESWSRPFLIMFTVPMALIGMYAALWMAGIQMSIFGQLGFVMLIGIVVNNAILIMDDLIINLERKIAPAQAMQLAVKNKFRPIVMTSIAAVLGILPMALGSGMGSETRASCGVGVVGGLVSSTILSLYVIPALYILFNKNKKAK